MISKELFNKAHEIKCNYPHFRTEPRKGFNEDGSWNPDNWNGGDLTFLRQFINTELDCPKDHIIKSFDDESNEDYENTLILSYNKYNEQNYLIITHLDNFENVISIYYITYYKDRGNTEQITKNLKPITEDEYLELLQILEKAFEINFEDYIK